MISLKQIHYALAVGRTLHFKRAAEICSVSQSALSTALAEMEKQLGFKVFERTNKKVIVTLVGQRMLEKAQQIKLAVDDLHKLADTEGLPLRSGLAIGMIPTVGPSLLPVLVPALRQHYPDLAVKVIEEQSHVLLDQLRSGDLDTAILALPYEHEGLLAFPFWSENFLWVTHRDDPLAKHPKIKASDLDKSSLMLLKEGHCLTDHILNICRMQESEAQGLRATSLLTLVQLVAGQLGSTLVPEMAESTLVSPHEDLISVPLADPGPHRQLAFLVRPNYPNLKNIELLIALITEALNQR